MTPTLIVTGIATFPCSKQFGDRLALVEDGHGLAGRREKRAPRVDAEVSVDGRQDVPGRAGPPRRVLALAVGGADDLSGPQPAAREQHTLGVGPVVTARALAVAAQPRRPPELAQGRDQHLTIQPAHVDVFD